MKALDLKAIFICFITVMPGLLYGQDNNKHNDTILLYKPLKKENHYFLNNHPFKEVTLEKGRPYKHDFPGGRPIRESDKDFHIRFNEGIGEMQTVKPKTFLMEGEIECKLQESNWKVYLYTEGLIEVVRTKENDPEGGLTWSKDKTITLLWDRFPIGMIGEKKDTIARFYISMNPSGDENLKYYIDAFETDEVTSLKKPKDVNTVRSDYYGYAYGYGIWGNIRKQELAILFDDVESKSYVFIDSVCLCSFRSDLDFLTRIKKDDRVQPYIIIDGTVDEFMKNDLIRLAFLSRYLKYATAKSDYKKLL